MKLPDRISISVLSQYFWCAEKTRLAIQKKLKRVETPAMRRGTICHTMLEKRPLNGHEETLKEFLPHPRVKLVIPFRGTKLVGIPDDLIVDLDNRVTVVEFKTKANKKKTSSESRKPAIFQLQVYCWMLDKYLKGSEFTLNDEHLLKYVTTTLDTFEEYKVEASLAQTEAMLNTMLTVFEEDRFIQPAFWKCKFCDTDAKSQCRYWISKEKHKEQAKDKKEEEKEQRGLQWKKEELIE